MTIGGLHICLKYHSPALKYEKTEKDDLPAKALLLFFDIIIISASMIHVDILYYLRICDQPRGKGTPGYGDSIF